MPNQEAGGQALERPSPRRVVRATLSRKSPFLPELFPSTIDYADIVFAQGEALLGEGSYGQASILHFHTPLPCFMAALSLTCMMAP